jgi:hypothetical protein
LLEHHYDSAEIAEMLDATVEACRAYIKTRLPSDKKGAAALEHLLGERILAESKFNS